MRPAWALRQELSVRGQQIAATNGSVHELTASEMPARHLRMRRKPTWKFLPRLLAEHLRTPGMGAAARQGPYRIAQGIVAGKLEMEGTGLREQFRRVAHEYLLLPANAREPCPEFLAGRFFRAGGAVWIQTGNPPLQRKNGPHRDRHESRRPIGGSQAHGDGFSNDACKNDQDVPGLGGSF